MIKKNLTVYKHKESFFEVLARTIALKYLTKKNYLFANERKHRMAIYANDWIGLSIYTKGIYEREELETLMKIIKPIMDIKKGETKVLDIGANIGNHSLYFSKYFNKILAFEPNPHTYQLLKFNSQFVSNIETFNFGLGEKTESLQLFEDETNFGGSSAIYSLNKTSSIKIDIKQLDNTDIDLSNTILMKIDVEGMEYEVLSGAIGLIKEEEPIIVFEQLVEEFEQNLSGTKSIRLLQKYGYKLGWIEIGNNKKNSWIFRRLKNFFEIFLGKTITGKFVISDQIPTGTYSMLVAIPQKYSYIFDSNLTKYCYN